MAVSVFAASCMSESVIGLEPVRHACVLLWRSVAVRAGAAVNDEKADVTRREKRYLFAGW